MSTPISKLILISTGDNEEELRRLEQGIVEHVHGVLPLEIFRLGMVQSLLHAYHEAALSVPDDNALLMFCHQDVRPLQPPPPSGALGAAPPLQTEYQWAKRAFVEPAWWLPMVQSMLQREDTGVMGVAGALGLYPDMPWWRYPDVSGAALHITPDREPTLNLYGPW
ncbi:hypothetical protein GF324_02010, partial [bacterium]|nr:hypothetical protein [bacterium]